MADRSKELYRRGYNFVVELEKKRIPFQKVSGLSAEGNFEALVSRGSDDWGVRIRSVTGQILLSERLLCQENFCQ